jgi:hypothetical protein
MVLELAGLFVLVPSGRAAVSFEVLNDNVFKAAGEE